MKLSLLTLDHVAFPIRDVAASRSFYADVLGLPLLRALSGDDWGGHAWLMMIFELAQGRSLALCSFACCDAALVENPPAEARHLAFAASSLEELADWRSRLAQNGVKVSEEDHGAQLSLYFQDPNGVTLEITAYRADLSEPPDAGAQEVIASWLRRHAAR